MEVNCRYTQSARYDDLINQATLVELGRASLKFVYRISRETDGSFLAGGKTTHACIDPDRRITRIPEILLKALALAST